MEQTKKEKLQEALNKTIKNYKSLIDDPKNNYQKWQEYGTFKSCLFCKVLSIMGPFDLEQCKGCPLYDEDNVGFVPSCANHKSWELLFHAIDESVIDGTIVPESYEGTSVGERLNMLKNAAQARLLYIRLTASRNGFRIGLTDTTNLNQGEIS